MKKIVKGNDFTLRIPVMKMVEGERVPFPLPACTDVVVRVNNSFKRIELPYTIDVAEDNIVLARVEGDQLSLGTYAVEVKGKIFGNDWRSNEYPQFQIVSNNADADTEFGETDEGDNSVEMDTALVILPPTVELSNLIADTNAALNEAKETNQTLTDNETARVEAEKQRVSAESERVKAEVAREKAEEGRVSDATSYTEAESSRVKAEQARVEAESTRAQSENERKAAEAARVVAESNRQTESAKAVEAANDATTQANATNDSIKAEEAERMEAEKQRVAAEEQRSLSEKQRETDFTSSKTACDNATSAAKEATENANEAAELCKEAVGKIKYSVGYDPDSYSIIINTED